MALAVGTLTPFDSKAQSWEEYCEISNFFEANEIEDAAKKQAILLSSVGSQTYSLMRNLLSPDKQEPELTSEKALKLVQAIEAANKDELDLQCQNKVSADVHAKQSTQTALKLEAKNKWTHKKPRTNCYRCGDHKQQECRFLQELCHKCGKKGHIRKMCKVGLPSTKFKSKGGGGNTSNSTPTL
ncbi:hypothetical protein QQF64_000425 [Cirrhinus molitorella]|uniref:CCHC-type domain-containing protein n=1 Tax=Cirrhinus molitorella TaxID=172907 RepID=A0ABR3NXT0_9TELE